MNKEEFKGIRHRLGKSQREMAQLLGISIKAVQSFEQGWRRIPVHVERQALFLLAMSNRNKDRICWQLRNCPKELRANCPAWQFKCGDLCWFINGTICRGRSEGSWQRKMEICRGCEVFKGIFSPSPFEQESSIAPHRWTPQQ
jgi:DNA-binding XRE family transcriptional regulator